MKQMALLGAAKDICEARDERTFWRCSAPRLLSELSTPITTQQDVASAPLGMLPS